MRNYIGKKLSGQYDFSGSCAPSEDAVNSGFWADTFTLGIFLVKPSSSGRCLKRGKVLLRVKGVTNAPKAAYARAREICSKLDAGELLSNFKKLEVVR